MNLQNKNDSGSVTAEFAVIFPIVVILAIALVGMTRVVMVQLNCHDAAREASYAVLSSDRLGTSPEVSEKIAYSNAEKVVGRSAHTTVQWHDDYFLITVQCPVSIGGDYFLPMNVQGQAKGMRSSIHQ